MVASYNYVANMFAYPYLPNGKFQNYNWMILFRLRSSGSDVEDSK